MSSGARLRLWARRILYVLVIPLAVLITGLLFYFHTGHPETLLRRRIVAGVSEALGRPVTVESVGLQYLPFRVVIEGFHSESPIISASRVEVSLSWRALLRGRILVSDVAVHGPVLDWEIDAQRLISRESPAASPPPDEGWLSRRLTLRHLEIDGGTIRIGSRRRAVTADLEEISFTARNATAGWKGPWEGSLTFSHGRFEFDEISISGMEGQLELSASPDGMRARNLSLTAQGLRIDGSGEVMPGTPVRALWDLTSLLDPQAPSLSRPLPEFAARQVALDARFTISDQGPKVTGSFTAQRPSIDLDRKKELDGPFVELPAEKAEGTFEAAGGRIEVEVNVNAIAGGTAHGSYTGTKEEGRSDATRQHELTITAQALDVEELMGRFDLPGDDRVAPASRVSGRATMRWLAGGIAEARGSAVLTFAPGQGSLPTSGTASVRWSGKRVTIEDSALHVPGSDLEIAGTVDGTRDPMTLALTCDLEAEDGLPLASFLEARFNLTGSSASRPALRPTDLKGQATAHLDVSGTTARPHLEASFDSGQLEVSLPGLGGGIHRDGEAPRVPISLDRATGEISFGHGSLALDLREAAGDGLMAAGRIEADPGESRLLRLDMEAPVIPAELLARLAGLPPSAPRPSGTVRASAHLLARPEDSGALSGSLALEAAEMEVGGLPLTDVKASADLGKDQLELKQAAFTLFSGSVRAGGRIALGQGPARGTIEVQVEGIDLADVDRTYPGPSMSGLVDAAGLITVNGPISVEGKLTGRAVKIAGIDLGQAHGSVGGTLDHVHVDLLDEEGDLAASVQFAGLPAGEDPVGTGAPGVTDITLNGTVTVRKLSLERIRPLLPPGALAGLKGETAGQITVHGSLRDPAGMELHARLDSLSLTAGDYPLHSDGEVSLTLMDRFLTLAPMRLMGEKTDLTVGGSMNLREGYDLTARIEGSYDLGLAEIVIPDMRASGPGTADLRVVEHGDTLAYGGTLTVDGGSIVHPSLPLPLQNVTGHGHFNEEGLLQIDEIRCDLGGGQAAGAGWARFDGARIPEMHLAVTGSGIRAEILPDLRAFFDADVTLDKDHEDYRLGGQIKIQRAIYSRPFGVEASALLLRSREFAPDAQRSAAAPTIYLDFDITADGDVWIRNEDALIEAATHLSLEGTLDKPELSGRISALEGGTYRFRGITYRIVGGSVDFVDVAKIDPVVDIEASTRVQEYEVTLRITGRFSKPVYELTSDPPLPRNQIVWLLLTGHTLDESGSNITQGAAEAQVAAYLAAGPVTGAVSAPLEKYLGVSSVQIDPYFLNGTADPSARVTLTKRVSENLRMIYSTNVGQSGQQIYQIEYNPGRIWDVLGTRDFDGSIGADLRFRRRWGMARPIDEGPAANGSGAGVEPPARLKVGRIQVVADHVVDSEKSLIHRLPFDEGSWLDRGDLLEGRESLRIHYVTHGYPAAQVEVFEEAPDPPDPCCINVRYAIRSGPEHSVRITGDVRPRPLRQAIKEAWMEPVILEDLVSEARRAALDYLKGEGLYSAQVDAETEAPEPDRRIVKLNVEPGEKVEVRSIIFAGNEEMPSDRLRRQMLTDTGGGLSGLFGKELLKEPVLLDDIAAIRSLYVASGYLSARVAPPSVSLSEDGKKADITILVKEGPQSVIGAVSIEGKVPDVDGEKMIESTGLVVGQSVSPEAVSQGADSLREMLDLEGFYRVRVSYRIEGPPAQTRVVFSVAAGDRGRVADVIIEGNTRTNTVIVKREITMKKGDHLSRSAILTTQQNLYKLGVFRSAQVVPEPVEGRPGFANVRVKLEEGAPWLTAWGLGYDSVDRTRASFEVANNNLFGTRRSAGLFVRASAVDERLQINLRDPNLFTHRIETLLSAFGERQDFDSYNVRRFGATSQLSRKLHRDQVTLFGRYRLEDINLYDLEISAEETGQQTVRLASIAGSVALDLRDDIVNPKSGGLSSFEYRIYDQGLGSEEQFSRVYASSSFFKEIGHGVIWASSVTAGLITSRDIPVSERFFAGGDTTLRGFSYNSVGPLDPETGNPIGGQGLFLLNQELRIPLYKALKSVVFFDAGNVFSDLSQYDLGELRHDIGVGLRFDTPVGPFRVEYGRKLERENRGEDLGQLFFSIGQAF